MVAYTRADNNESYVTFKIRLTLVVISLRDVCYESGGIVIGWNFFFFHPWPVPVFSLLNKFGVKFKQFKGKGRNFSKMHVIIVKQILS